MTTIARTLSTLGALGAAGLAYGLAEARSWRVQGHRLEVRPEAPTVRVLHVSDTHMKGADRAKQQWLRRLPELVGETPDLVLATGDLLETDAGIDHAVEALAGLQAKWGKWYVLGSHDYQLATVPGYVRYWTGNREKVRARSADTSRLEEGLKEGGWRPLTNTTETIETPAGRIRLTGVDDPYIKRHRTGHIVREAGDDLAIGLVHAPEVVSDYALRGYDLVLAGHTHGGQVRVPGAGAVVTNCSLPCGIAAGPSRIGSTWLHVSPGIAQGKFAPIRFNCRPEATLLELVPGTHT